MNWQEATTTGLIAAACVAVVLLFSRCASETDAHQQQARIVEANAEVQKAQIAANKDRDLHAALINAARGK